MIQIGKYRSIINETIIIMEDETAIIRDKETNISLNISFKIDSSTQNAMSGFEIKGNEIFVHLINHNNPIGNMTSQDRVIGQINGKDLVVRVSTHTVDKTKLFTIFLGVTE